MSAKKNLIYLSILFSLGGCNGVGGYNNTPKAALNSITNASDTVHTLAAIRDNDLYFNGVKVNKNQQLFIEDAADGHSITSGQPWGGVRQEPSNHINVRAGRKGNKSNFEWLENNNYNPRGNKGNADLKSNFNFAVKGTLVFNYLADEKDYTCKNIAITQFGYSVQNPWMLFSNITYKPLVTYDLDAHGGPAIASEDFKAASFGYDQAVDIVCSDDSNSQNKYFKVESPRNSNNYTLKITAIDSPGI